MDVEIVMGVGIVMARDSIRNHAQPLAAEVRS